MGVTVQSQGPGGKIVRRMFVNTPLEYRDITGRCYVLSQDLTIDSLSDEDGGNWNFCKGRPRGHEMFGSCQQGIVRVEQKNNTLIEMGVYDDGPYEVGDEHLLSPELVPVPANSYLAPYDDGGAGKVYIYHGSAEGIKTSPAQILSGKEHNMRLFGYSLAGNMDLDTIGYSVEADADRRKQGLTSRVAFLNKSRPETDYQLNGTLDLRGQNQKSCIKITARLKDNIKDKMRSIPIEVSAEIVGTKRQKTRNGLPQLMPILDSSQPSKDVIEVNFVKEGCGRDHICRSNLKMEYKLYYKQSNLDVYSPLPM
ncbi:Integrin alpha-6 [Liparis tanakae]|uniref:Integrin alpha-6 n=1 Tax=Liparis tanakae TaxID=230148 RepID=A0A4Z2H1M4_9TELE|nr:Integrin alpha-6 [Liparis tanakae]